uniref:E3 ubiquitin-protein ligase RNF170 n=1 Tax=Brugia malayi TaxID=6279 RepID=A0A0I9N7X7_BRUMA|nr:BMA-DRN-1 [Brugia malayi]
MTPTPLPSRARTLRRFGDDHICPICFGQASFAVVTNCGHLFCCNCIYGYWQYSASLITPVKCAVCREIVNLLIPLPVEGERENSADEALRCDEQLTDYNRRFSSERRPIIDYIRDLPVLVPHMFRAVVSVNGLMFMFRIRFFLCLCGMAVYILSPFDILPEAAFGVLGMVDDIFIAFVVLSGRIPPEHTSDYRVAVFGAGGVGKSSIVQRFIKGTFNENYIPTIEDTFRQVISCNHKNVCTLQITDTTGSHQFPAMQRLSISKGNAFVLVYSVTSKQSLEELGPILLMLKEVKGENITEVPIMLVGNKKDEDQRREVSSELGQKLAAKWGTGFIETSAKDNENITELFQRLLAMEKKRTLALTMDEESSKSGSKRKCSLM